MPPSMEAQTIQIRSITYLVFCPLPPLHGIRYHSLLLQHCQTQFKDFNLPNQADFLAQIHDHTAVGKQSQEEVSVIGKSQWASVAFHSLLSFAKTQVPAQFPLCRKKSTNFLIKGFHLKYTERSSLLMRIKLWIWICFHTFQFSVIMH